MTDRTVGQRSYSVFRTAGAATAASLLLSGLAGCGISVTPSWGNGPEPHVELSKPKVSSPTPSEIPTPKPERLPFTALKVRAGRASIVDKRYGRKDLHGIFVCATSSTDWDKAAASPLTVKPGPELLLISTAENKRYIDRTDVLVMQESAEVCVDNHRVDNAAHERAYVLHVAGL